MSNETQFTFVIFLSGFAFGVLTVFALMMLTSHDQEKFLKSCMEDGRKEYECVAMFSSRTFYPK